MVKTKPLDVKLPMPHPFVRVFPRAALAVAFVGAVIRIFVGLVRTAWPWRRELTIITVLCGLWATLDNWIPLWPAGATTISVAAGTLAVPSVRRRFWAWL